MGLQLSGSVQLEGNLLVTGSANSVFENISVTNRITANEINVQFVSSSIIYSSGSNRFGDLITDTQQFTGSVDVSGSVTATTLVRRGGTSSQFLMADGSVNTNVLASGAYLPLTGGTLTGALNGTTADFTGASGAFIAVTATTTDSAGSARLRVSSTGGNINDFSSFSAAHPSRANQAWIGGDGNSLTTVLQAGGTEFLRGASTGEATFSSNVGLGVTSSAWFSDRRALQIQSGGSINGSASTPAFVELGANFFHGSLGDTYIASSQATKYRQVSGAHEWYTAPSGTSNTAINFTSSMSLTAAGVLTMGSSETGAGRISFNQSSNTLRIQSSKDGTECTPIEFWSQRDGGLFTQSMSISGSNVGIGSTGNPADFIDAGLGMAIISSTGRTGFTLGSDQTVANEVLGRVSFTNTNSTNIGNKRLAYISGIRGATNNSAYLEFGTANDGLGTQKMVLDVSGSLGLGTASPRTSATGGHPTLDIKGGIYFGSRGSESTCINNDDSMIFNIDADNDASGVNFFRFATNTTLETGGTELMRITDAALVAVGGINSTLIDFDGGTTARFYGGSATNTFGLGAGSTTYYQGDASQFYPTADNTRSLGVASNRYTAVWAVNGTIQTSDEREKKNIIDSDLGLGFITKLRPVSFKWKVGQNVVTTEVVKDEEGNPILDEEGNEKTESVITPREGKRTHYGLIAQEVEAVLGDKDFGGFIRDEETDTRGLRYDQFVPLLIKAIQEQQSQIEELKTKVEQLQNN
jgi:hypothetical protein